MNFNARWLVASVLGVAATLTCAAVGQGSLSRLKVCATTADLGSLAKEIGGDQVAVTVFCSGLRDPHFLEAKPSHIMALSQSDALIVVGLELEVGWVPLLQREGRNSALMAGNSGYIDASLAVAPLEVPKGIVDRSLGDVHGLGNPHYLLDPVDGLAVAGLLRERFSEFRPAAKVEFASRFDSFRKRLGTLLVGEKLAAKYRDFEKLARLHESGSLLRFLEKQGDRDLLGGWIGNLAAYHGSKVVAEHNLWPYFARRFGFQVADFMEPKPGVPPSTGHLEEIINTMKSAGIRVILSSAYYDQRHANFVAQKTGARIAVLAHQPGAISGAEDYLSTVDLNVKRMAEAFGATGGG